MKVPLRPLFAGGLSVAIAATSLLGSSSMAFAATPPSIITLSISTPVYQGDKPTVTATFTDPDLADHHTVDIDWGDFSYDSYPLPLGARSFSVQKSTPYMNRGPFVVQVTLSDPISSTTRFLNITVLNAPPSITSFGLSTSAPAAGQAVTATGAFTDPGAADTHTVTLDWGDSSPTTTMNLAAAVYSFTSGAHIYTAAGSYTVTATVSDSAGASAVATSTVTVHAPNQPPSVVSFVVTAGSEGGSSILSLAFADPDPLDTHNVSVVWGDGSTSGPTLLAAGVTSYSTTHVYADTGTYQVVLTLGDRAGHSVTAAASVSPINVAPVVGSLSLSPSSVVDHQTLTVSGTFTDPGTADTFTVVVDWGDGSAPSTQALAAGTRTFTASHDYLAAGPYVVTATVTDRDHAAGTQTASLVVLARNTSPSSLALSPTVNGRTVAVSASFVDPDVLDTHTVTMSWGDGTTTTWTLAAGVTSFNASHTYATSGTYTLNATVTDPSSASANASVLVTVSAGTAAELLDQMSGLVRSFDLDRNTEPWILRRIDELKASLATGSTQLCTDLKTLAKLSAFASHRLSTDQYAALSALATQLEAAARCAASNFGPTGEPEQTTPGFKAETAKPVAPTSADKDKSERSDTSEKQDKQPRSGRDHADRSEGRD
jgi:PKD repeat protein